MIRIGHFSDLHGDYDRIAGIPDVWVNTGDFFPNMTRGDVSVEVPFQTAWFEANADAIIARLAGKPLIWVAGNHDFVNLVPLLRSRGVEAWDATEAPVDFMGERFAGLREIPWIEGEWAGEAHDMAPAVERAFDADPTILVTHCPPSGILDNDGGAGHGFGSSPMTTALTWRHHRIHTHLFGHIHAMGGKDVEEMGIRFFNGSNGCRIISVG
jgi:Icc-related predicted phosphoesterase